MWCSQVEPTTCVPRQSLWQQFSPPCTKCHGVALAGSGALRAQLRARVKSWQVLGGCENCCHGDHLGTQGVNAIHEHHNRILMTAGSFIHSTDREQMPLLRHCEGREGLTSVHKCSRSKSPRSHCCYVQLPYLDYPLFSRQSCEARRRGRWEESTARAP